MIMKTEQKKIVCIVLQSHSTTHSESQISLIEENLGKSLHNKTEKETFSEDAFK